MSNTAEEILGALRSSVVALGDLVEAEPSPYVSDAQSFATQAGVCIEKHLTATGREVPPDPSKPAPPPAPDLEETRRDGDKTA